MACASLGYGTEIHARSASFKRSDEREATPAFHGVGGVHNISFTIMFGKVRKGFFW